jgi:hypothetical protein
MGRFVLLFIILFLSSPDPQLPFAVCSCNPQIALAFTPEQKAIPSLSFCFINKTTRAFEVAFVDQC